MVTRPVPRERPLYALGYAVGGSHVSNVSPTPATVRPELVWSCAVPRAACHRAGCRVRHPACGATEGTASATRPSRSRELKRVRRPGTRAVTSTPVHVLTPGRGVASGGCTAVDAPLRPARCVTKAERSRTPRSGLGLTDLLTFAHIRRPPHQQYPTRHCAV